VEELVKKNFEKPLMMFVAPGEKEKI